MDAPASSPIKSTPRELRGSELGRPKPGSGRSEASRPPSRVFKETLERGGLWGIKFPQAASSLFRACVRPASPRRAESAGTVGGVYGACAKGPGHRPSKFEAHFPARPSLVGAFVELVYRPVRPDPRMPPG